MTEQLRTFKEITAWEDDTPNHIYVTNPEGHLVGYFMAETNDWIKFKAPMKGFTKSKRRFKEIPTPAICYDEN